MGRVRIALQWRGKPAEEMDRWVPWVEGFIRFHKMRHPEAMAETECGAYLTHLLHDRRATLPQLAQARQALVFLYRDFLHRPLGTLPMRWTLARGSTNHIFRVRRLLHRPEQMRKRNQNVPQKLVIVTGPTE